jgi:hypothetical protein
VYKYRATNDGQPVGTVYVNNIVHDIKTAKNMLAEWGHTGSGVKLAYKGKDSAQGSPYWSD